MAKVEKKETDEVLAAHVAGGKSVAAAAAAMGISVRTARRRMEGKEFRDAVARLKSEAVGQAVAFLSSDMLKAAEKLSALIDSADERVSLAASKTLLEMALKARSAEEVEQKVRELEERLNALTPEESPRGQFGED